MTFAPVEELIREIANGKMIIMVDDPGRENEGDLLMAAQLVNPEAINFMTKYGRGLICAPLPPEHADRLALPLMTADPTNPRECAFTISVDATVGTTTGISAFDRARTAQVLADPRSVSGDLRRPGHLFPLRARAGGVLERAGHTEAAIDLARLAGLAPVGLICEVMNEDGTMSRLGDLERMAEEHGLLLGNIADLQEYRRQHDGEAPAGVPGTLEPASTAQLPTPFGVFDIRVFESGPTESPEEIVVLSLGDVKAAAARGEAILTRVHSACFTGDVLGSLQCDCGGQLQMALQRIGESELGMLIYLPQEGRGIGLAKKIAAYDLQQRRGLDTVEANHELGFAADLRTYEDAVAVLRWFGADRLRLLTNNPAKIHGLEHHGITITERVAVEAGPGPINHAYLKTKKGKLGHLFEAV